MRLEGKVAIVTGGGHGIGAEYARAFAQEGAKVVVADVDEVAAKQVAERLAREGYQALGLRVDVADFASASRMVERTVEAFGRVDVLMNNAAIFATIPISREPFDRISEDEWDRVMAVNVKGVWQCCRAVAPAMCRQGGGSIINISSSTVFKASGRIHYVASKAAVVGFTRVLAAELGGDNIRVNAIAPGSTLSEADPTPEIVRMREAAIAGRALKRLQRPGDLLGTAVFLASDDSAFVTGQTLVVDGGGVMY
ncbi:MAG: 3-oxoacyl-ACP reductase FabG [Chloroflexi bacterium]|nr:3-oxoacyl-ACP reductase FabG [Chloroflexota bacterium]